MRRQTRELIKLRERIAKHLEEPETEPIPNPEHYRFLTSKNIPGDWQRFGRTVRFTTQTYDRVAEVMERLDCNFSDAVEAMICDVEACKVQPIDKNWRKKYRKSTLWQSLDLQKVLRIRKRKQ